MLQIVGVNPKGSRLPLDLYDVHFREIRIHGAYGRGGAFRRALALLPTLGVKRLISARFPLARIEEAFAHAAAGRGGEDGHHARRGIAGRGTGSATRVALDWPRSR